MSTSSKDFKLFLYFFGISFLGLGAFYIINTEFTYKILLTVVFFFSLYLPYSLLLPLEERQQKTIRRATFSLFSLYALSLTYANSTILKVFSNFFPQYLSKKLIENTPPYDLTFGVLIIATIAYALLLYFQSDRTPLGRLKTHPLSNKFIEPDASKQYDMFCQDLKDDLHKLNSELDWNVEQFVSLDAEVEIKGDEYQPRKIMDLLDALQTNHKSQIHVVLGNPGSGKSVALRKMCSDLIQGQSKTDRIPVYINLKEWISKGKWSTEQLPKDEDFKDFVKSNIKNRLSFTTKDFFDLFFDDMLKAGHFFFVFDSFDEIPIILDQDESSEFLKEISDIIIKFIKAGYQSRGIIASRYYRQPIIFEKNRATLEIRPFSDLKISTAIKKASGHKETLLKDIFNNRPDLGVVVRTPFYLSLLLHYFKKENKLPDNQSELFKFYINDRLDCQKENIQKYGITKSDLHTMMKDIAVEMFDSDGYGLEIPQVALQAKFKDRKIDTILGILEDAKLIRLSSSNKTMSFVHRRFHEYFLVQRFLNDPRKVPLNAISEDFRWRDALVLYTEVTDADYAKTIAGYCWHYIKGLDSTKYRQDQKIYRKGLRCLRFLIESFQGRKEILEDISDDLGRVVLLMAKSNDLLQAKHAVEAVGLLNEKDAEKVLITALSKNDSWISETALGACRYFTRLSPSTTESLNNYISSVDIVDLFRLNKELSFSLKVSDIYRPLLFHFKILQVDSFISILSLS